MFKEWNKIFNKLKYKHDTWYIFRDFLDLTIDNFTIPGQEPLFTNKDKYSEREYGFFGELFYEYMKSMQKALENKPYCDFLGEWWESDQDMTNKFKRHDAEHYPCDCGMMYNEMQFKPRDEYVDKIALKICLAIGEPIEDLEG